MSAPREVAGGETPETAPQFELIGDDQGVVCVDGVCLLPGQES
jgi:hypothetical protein